MTDHEHLVLQPPEANLSAGTQYLNGSYTSYFNRHHRRAGHLFQGRLQGHLAEEEGYFLEVSRYIHLNPVRAKMAARPEQYRWSSFGGYMRADWVVSWIVYDKVLDEVCRDLTIARRAYGRFVRAGIDEPVASPFAATVGGLLLGSETFVSRIQRLIDARPADAEVPETKRLRSRPAVEQILAAVADYFGYDEPPWTWGRRSDDRSRAAAAYLARRRFGYPATLVAAALGYRDASGVSHAIKRIEAGPPALRETLRRLERRLT